MVSRITKNNIFSLRMFFVTAVVVLPFSAQSQPSSKYLHPMTGEDCVRPTEGPQSSKKYGYFYFENICERSFRIHMTFGNGESRGNGIGPGSKGRPGTQKLICEHAKGECKNVKWEVR